MFLCWCWFNIYLTNVCGYIHNNDFTKAAGKPKVWTILIWVLIWRLVCVKTNVNLMAHTKSDLLTGCTKDCICQISKIAHALHLSCLSSWICSIYVDYQDVQNKMCRCAEFFIYQTWNWFWLVWFGASLKKEPHLLWRNTVTIATAGSCQSNISAPRWQPVVHAKFSFK